MDNIDTYNLHQIEISNKYSIPIASQNKGK